MEPPAARETRELRCEIKRASELAADDRVAMYALMSACYDGISLDRFRSDLAWKDLVILLRDKVDRIRGFSTIAYNPAGCATDAYNVVFSGDTIIDPAHWGSSALSRGFRSVLGGFKGAGGDKTLYWFLISKGHRTYLYLPLYFRRYYPAAEKKREEDLRAVADACAAKLFPDAWNSNAGLIRFADPHDRLKPEFAEVSAGKTRNPHVSFFLSKNPGFERGDELVCLARVDTENLLRADPACFGEALARPPVLFRDIVAQNARMIL